MQGNPNNLKKRKDKDQVDPPKPEADQHAEKAGGDAGAEPEKPVEPEKKEEEAPAEAPAPSPSTGTPDIVSKSEAEQPEIGELEITNEVEEVVGSTDWEDLFGKMKDFADEAGKDVSVRPSKRDPEDS